MPLTRAERELLLLDGPPSIVDYTFITMDQLDSDFYVEVVIKVQLLSMVA